MQLYSGPLMHFLSGVDMWLGIGYFRRTERNFADLL
jgi:hypothetical protein